MEKLNKFYRIILESETETYALFKENQLVDIFDEKIITQYKTKELIPNEIIYEDICLFGINTVNNFQIQFLECSVNFYNEGGLPPNDDKIICIYGIDYSSNNYIIKQFESLVMLNRTEINVSRDVFKYRKDNNLSFSGILRKINNITYIYFLKEITNNSNINDFKFDKFRIDNPISDFNIEDNDVRFLYCK